MKKQVVLGIDEYDRLRLNSKESQRTSVVG